MKVKLIQLEDYPMLMLGFKRKYKNTKNPFLFFDRQIIGFEFYQSENFKVYYYSDEIRIPKIWEPFDLWYWEIIKRVK
jgi:hypothetical protein